MYLANRMTPFKTTAHTYWFDPRSREALRIGRSEREVMESLSQFDVPSIVIELQHDFCTLWNEIVHE